MASKWPPVKNAEYIFRTVLFAQSDNQIISNPTLASGDWKVSTDGGTFANLGTLPDVDPDSTVQVKVTLSAAEMNGDEVMVYAKDASGDEWHSAAWVIHTAGQTFDTVDTNVDSILADTGTDGVVLANDAITAAKFDESTAYPLKSADTGATAVARTGADSDTLETLSDQLDATATAAALATVDGIVDDILVDTGTTLPATLSTISGYVDGVESAIAALNDPTAAAIADAVWEEALADHSGTAGSTAEILADIDAEVDEIHQQIDAIAVTGSQLNQIAASATLTTGTQTSGTYASTHAEDNTRHVITAASNTIDIYYQFDIGAAGVPVSVSIEGYLKEGAPAGGDTIDLYAYNWVGAAWELIHSALFTGIITDGPDATALHTLFARHVGTGNDDGVVRVRFYSTTLEAGTTLNIDQIYVSYAESIAGDIAAILEDTGTTLPGTLATAAALATVDGIVDDILVDTNELQTNQGNWATADVSGLATAAALATVDTNVDSILADTGTDGVVLSAATAQAIADAVLSRGVSNVEDTADQDSIAQSILASFHSVMDGTTWTIYKTDDATTFVVRGVQTDADADPVVGANTPT